MTRPYQLTTINGIKTVLYPIKDLPSVRLELISHAGSWQEKGKNWGAFHLIEHLTLQGTEQFPTALDIELFKEEHGLNSNAYAGGDALGYWVKAPYYSLEQAAILLSQAAFKPIFPENSFAKELSVITQEYRDKWDNPYNRFGKSVDIQFFGKHHPYIRDGIGQPEFIRTLTRKQLQQLHSSYFTSDNLILSVTGNFSVPRAKKLLKQYLVPFPGKVKNPLPIPKRKPGAKTTKHHENVQQNRLIIQWPLPGRNQLPLKERLTINIGRYILGGTARSILFQELREKRGLVYRTGASHFFKPEIGYFEVWCSTDPIHSKEALATMGDLTRDFLTQPLNPAVFSRAVNYMNASTIANFDSIDEISSSITSNLFHDGKIYLPDDYIKLAKDITPKLVQDLLNEYLTPKTKQISIMTGNATSKTSHAPSAVAD